MDQEFGARVVTTAANAELTAAEREAVLTELNRLLSDPSFNRSNRCVLLLRNLTARALDGEYNTKERTLGIEVFGRNPNYDTNSDPIVRMTANEIRKRIAQYYLNPEHRRAVIIHLDSGKYLPYFEFTKGDLEQGGPVDDGNSPGHVAEELSDGQSSEKRGKGALLSSFWSKRTVWLLLIVIAAAATALTLSRNWLHPASQYLIWSPMLKASVPLVICVPDNPALQDGQQKKTSEEQAAQTQIFADMAELRKAPEISDLAKHRSSMPFEDARVAQLITRWLATRGRDTTLQQASSLTFRDFHRENVMMVGGFDNPWSVILLTGLRYSLRADPATGTLWIKDTQNPAKRNWARSDKADSSDADYAIIASFYDEELKNRIMVIGGLGKHGTEAAARLLLDASLDGQIPGSVRSANNFEMVIKTYEVNGETAPPQIVAAHTW